MCLYSSSKQAISLDDYGAQLSFFPFGHPISWYQYVSKYISPFEI
jgi:hypothetical protein